LTEAPNGGHIQHPSSHLGEELLKLYLYFPSPLLPPEQAYPEGYDEKGGTEKHSVVEPSRGKIRYEVVDNAREQQARPK